MATAFAPVPSKLPFEHEDVREDFRAVLTNADEWLATPNVIFQGQSPNHLIEIGQDYRLREVFRSVIFSSMA